MQSFAHPFNLIKYICDHTEFYAEYVWIGVLSCVVNIGRMISDKLVIRLVYVIKKKACQLTRLLLSLNIIVLCYFTTSRVA